MQSITGNRPVCTQAQHGDVCGDSASKEDHTWLLNPGTHNSAALQEFKSMSTIKQCAFTKTELEMDQKIKENKAKLQKKLQRLEEKLRQNNLREPTDTPEGERVKREEAEARRKQGVKGGEKEVVQYLQLQRKEDKIPKITFHGQNMVGEDHPQRDSAKKLMRGKGRDRDSRENGGSVVPNCVGKDIDEPKRAQESQHETHHGGRGPGEETEEPLLPSVWRPQPEITDEIPKDFQLLPCTVCNRRFESKRLEAHVRICRKASKSQRPLYDGKRHRTKGTELEQFLKTHGRAEPPKAGC